MRRAATNRWPTRAERRIGPVAGPFRYQASGLDTEATVRPRADSASWR